MSSAATSAASANEHVRAPARPLLGGCSAAAAAAAPPLWRPSRLPPNAPTGVPTGDPSDGAPATAGAPLAAGATAGSRGPPTWGLGAAPRAQGLAQGLAGGGRAGKRARGVACAALIAASAAASAAARRCAASACAQAARPPGWRRAKPCHPETPYVSVKRCLGQHAEVSLATGALLGRLRPPMRQLTEVRCTAALPRSTYLHLPEAPCKAKEGLAVHL